MRIARTVSGDICYSEEYQVEKHGSRLFCIDSDCQAPVIFVKRSKTSVAHFKTTGKEGSKHKLGCGFYQSLDMFGTVLKVSEYQESLLKQGGLPESVIRLSLKGIDPDYVPRQVERNTETTKEIDEQNKPKVKDKKDTPQSLSSVKSVARLLQETEPDLLATILFNIGGGRKEPLSSIILDQEKAHKFLWGEQALKINYFVYGTIESITRRDKVIYLNFTTINDVTFSLVVFDKYFKEFTYSDLELQHHKVLVYGKLRKNEFNNQMKTEMVIKSNSYIERLN
ncbi:hypothetical protein M3202_15245 [Alkalihalobacillus oceani]|uniref:OB domain-containing protein n=1 Tax=Halalkalibacter oceani TaxID=1653776 RepID=A0A9X2DRM8_9BACI|nr:hypothetical protein [Halalkalibacter oceani]MCM3715426.1 hypothetical protein [Halalkalibacter oceani]